MPYDIQTIQSPSHTIRLKQTATKAVVQHNPRSTANHGLDKDFVLLIALQEVHRPRMWIEKDSGDHDHQAALLAFYPKFEYLYMLILSPLLPLLLLQI